MRLDHAPEPMNKCLGLPLPIGKFIPTVLDILKIQDHSHTYTYSQIYVNYV